MAKHEPQPAAAMSPGVLWTLRALTLVALAVGGFLLYLDVGYLIAKQTSDVPFCSWAEWLDCSAVIYHPKWSHWFGVPVAAFGFATYLLVFILLFAVRSDRPAPRWVWLTLHAASVAIIGAAGWFVWVQYEEIGKWCQYCLIEHAVGAVLAVLLILHAFRYAPTGRFIATMVAVAGVGLLIVGQRLYEPVIVEKVVVGKIDERGKYVEPGATAVFQYGHIQLNASAHLLLGKPDAEHFIVLAADYTCPHCKSVWEMFDEAEEMLGPKYAVIMLPYPVSHRCNKVFVDTPAKHEAACYIAKLAQAVWLVDPDKFGEFHAWLFENQKGMTREKALDRAKQLVDVAALEGYRADPAGDPHRLLQRDIELANRLGIKELPGIFVADVRFIFKPQNARDLVDKIHGALGQ